MRENPSERYKEVLQLIRESQKDYYRQEVDAIWGMIRTKTLEGCKSFWYTFYWEDGDFEEIINYFEGVGIFFGVPTGPDRGEYTMFLVDITKVLEDL